MLRQIKIKTKHSEQIFSRNRYPETTHVVENEYKIQAVPDNNQCSCYDNLNRNL